MYKYDMSIGGKISKWRKRVDRALKKLKANNCVVHVTRRKRTHNYTIHILCYDLSTVQRQNYVDRRGKKFMVRESGNCIEFPINYANEDRITGTYGVLWAMRIAIPDQGGVKIAYSTYTSPDISNMFRVDVDDLELDVLLSMVQDQFYDVPVHPNNWVTDNITKLDWRLANVDSIQSIPAMLISAREDVNKIISILADHLNIKLSRPDNIINVPEIIALPNN